MMRYTRFKILILLCSGFSFCVMAQETESGLQKNTVNELNKAVENLVAQAKDPNRLIEFKRLRSLVSVPFSSTPLFLQTLESLKLAEERKNEIFSRFLPRVTSSVGGGIKSGGLNNNSSSQSLSLNVTQLVYDFGVTGRQLDAAEKEALASQAKVENQTKFLYMNYRF